MSSKVIFVFDLFALTFCASHHVVEVHDVILHALSIIAECTLHQGRLRLTMAAESAFRWWSLLQSVKEEGALDGQGFPASTSKDTLEAPVFGQDDWSDSISDKSSGDDVNPPWFFDADDYAHPSVEEPTPVNGKSKQVWSKEDDDMLDMLLSACGASIETKDVEIPDLQWSYSFDEPAWEFETKNRDDYSAAETKLSAFFSQDFQWNESKFFHGSEALSAASTESGSSYTGSDDDDVSTLTPTTGLYSIASIATAIGDEDMSLDKDCWYRAKIASLFAPRKKAVVKLKQDELEVWPTQQVSSMAVEAPLLVQVTPEELARRMFVMEERQAKQAQIEQLAQSPDPDERKDAANQLKELWLAAYKKRSRGNAGSNLESTKDNIPAFVEM